MYRISLDLRAPARKVFAALYRAALLEDWLAERALAEPFPGGRLVLLAPDVPILHGTFEELVEPKRVVWTLAAPPWVDHARLQVELHAVENQETRLEVALETSESEGVQSLVDFLGQGFRNLKSVYETGVDLREQQRGVLGIVVEETPESPEGPGVAVRGVLPGSPAARAGLQPGDLLVRLGDVPLDSWHRLRQVLTTLRAGQEVEVHLLRAGKPHTLRVLLGHADTLQLPETPAELARRVRELHANLMQQITEILTGVSDQVAVAHSGQVRWSIKEILAHLIVAERQLHQDIALAVVGAGSVELESDPLALQVRLEAILTTHPQIQDLLDELRRDFRESEVLLEGLRLEDLPHPGRFRRIARTVLEYHYHALDHVEQLQQVRNSLPTGT